MCMKIWFLLIFGSVNYPLQIRAVAEKKTCPAHEKWTVFQRRVNGNVDFFRGWDDYVNGFGECDGDFWLGLETLHQLTKENDMSLEINMMSKDKKDHLWAKYRCFRIGPGSDNYTLHVSRLFGSVTVVDQFNFRIDYVDYSRNDGYGDVDRENASGYSGNATGDGLDYVDYSDFGFDLENVSGYGLTYHNNLQSTFSTKDADHDGDPYTNCASLYEGGWWYSNCGGSNLNGNFNKTGDKGIWWWSEVFVPHYLCCSEMKIYKRLAADQHCSYPVVITRP